MYRLTVTALFCLLTPALAQRGMSFAELAQALEPYFDRSLIADLRTQLPLGAAYEIWGWDAGDFSGDGYPDLAVTVYIPQERQRRVRVYAFVDQDGFLLNVAQMTLSFLELPLEVGIAIRDTTCFVTQKHRPGLWSIRGYRYWRGYFTLWEERTLENTSHSSTELRLFYHRLEKEERRFRSDGQLIAQRRSLVVPAYHRSQRLSGGYAAEALCTTVDYILQGAYYWEGPQDLALQLRAAYDESFLYLALRVSDDAVVTGRCDSCPADFLRLWFARPRTDTTPTPTSRSGRRRTAPAPPAWDFLELTLRLGDFAEKLPQLTLHSTHGEVPPTLRNRIKAVVARRPEGYTAKLRIPLALLTATPPATGSEPLRLSCTVQVMDIDNEFRPEEATALYTSSDFVPSVPHTYAELLLIPVGQWYGESSNIFVDAIADELLQLGF